MNPLNNPAEVILSSIVHSNALKVDMKEGQVILLNVYSLTPDVHKALGIDKDEAASQNIPSEAVALASALLRQSPDGKMQGFQGLSPVGVGKFMGLALCSFVNQIFSHMHEFLPRQERPLAFESFERTIRETSPSERGALSYLRTMIPAFPIRTSFGPTENNPQVVMFEFISPSDNNTESS